ncbi:MAG: hypothetical protein ACTH31_05030 [Pseudoclavibacter sp.]
MSDPRDRGADGNSDGADDLTPSSNDYSAPKLYDSSDFLSKYTSPTLPADDDTTHDILALDDDDAAGDDAAGEDAGDEDAAGEDAADSSDYDYHALDDAWNDDDLDDDLDDDWGEDLDDLDDEHPDEETARHRLLEQVDTAARRLEARGGAAGATAEKLRVAANDAAGDSPSPSADGGWKPEVSWRPDEGSTPFKPTSKPTVTYGKPAKGKPNVGMTLAMLIGMGLLVLAFFDAPGFVWPVAIVLGIGCIIQLVNRGGAKVRAAITLVLVAATLIVQIVVSSGAVENVFDGGGGNSAGGGDDTLDVGANPTIDGSGNAQLDVVLPDGDATPAVIEVVSYDETVRVSEVDAERDDSSRVYTGYSEDTGLAPINAVGDLPTVALEIESDGEWTITLSSVDSLRSFDDEITGNGNDLIYYTGDGGDAVFTMSVEDSFSIDTYAGDEDWWYSNMGATSLTRPFASGPVLIMIESYDAWAISVGPPSDSGSGGAEGSEAGADSAGGDAEGEPTG